MVTDINMPQMNGVRLAAKLRETRPNLKFILMLATLGYLEELVAAGWTCIGKPSTLAELLHLVHEQLGNPAP